MSIAKIQKKDKVSLLHGTNYMHCNPLQGNYRFFIGNSLCSISTLTCFGSVQGLKGQISLKYMHSIQELAFHIYIQVYGFITGFPLFFVKQQHGNLIKQFRHCAVSGIDFNKKKRIIWFHPFSGIDFHKSRNILISPVNRNRFPL